MTDELADHLLEHSKPAPASPSKRVDKRKPLHALNRESGLPLCRYKVSITPHCHKLGCTSMIFRVTTNPSHVTCKKCLERLMPGPRKPMPGQRWISKKIGVAQA